MGEKVNFRNKARNLKKMSPACSFKRE